MITQLQSEEFTEGSSGGCNEPSVGVQLCSVWSLLCHTVFLLFRIKLKVWIQLMFPRILHGINVLSKCQSTRNMLLIMRVCPCLCWGVSLIHMSQTHWKLNIDSTSYKMLGLIRHFHICIYAYYDYLIIYKRNIYLEFEVSE